MRISLFGGPGIGKSALAHQLVADLKRLNFNVDMANEWIKAWAYQKKQLQPWDQFHVFGQQIHIESMRLNNGVDVVVSDSPILMQYAYMKRDKATYASECRQIAMKFEDDYPAINIRLLRGGFDYQSHGRWESQEQALAMDEMIKQTMDENLKDYLEFRAVDHADVLREIVSRLGRCC